MTRTNRSLLAASIPLAALLLAGGCSSRTYISATGSTPPQFTHVYITTQAIWLNPSASVGPDDSGWAQYPLTTPVTVDLIAAANGTLERIIGGLTITPGTYHQIQLIPVPYSSSPSVAAQAAGAKYDQEVDYYDSTGEHQVPLQILNPDKGISIPGSLNVPFKLGGTLGSPHTTGTNGLLGSSSTPTSTASSTPQNVSFAINFNGATDIALFYYQSDPTASDCTPASATAVTKGCSVGAVLNSHASAYDLSRVGGISGTLSITLPNGYTNASNRLNITATAESLSADGSRHVAVLSAPVSAEGNFTLYPLPATTDTAHPTTYDVVIHGAGIETMIVKGVQVTLSSTATASSSTTAQATSTATANTSIGTLVPVTASPYTVGIAPTLPAGAAVAFYQTLPGANEVPYVIETAAIDPVNRTLVLPQPLSSGPLESGTYSTAYTATTTVAATGQTVTLTSATPQENAGCYKFGGIASLFGEAPLTAMSAPAGASCSSADAQVTPAALPVQSGAASATIMAAVTPSRPGAYNAGVLFVSQGGAIIASAPLDTQVLAQGGTVPLSGLPGGSLGSPFAPARYYLSTLVWNTSSNPVTLTPQSFPTAVDLREGSVADVQVTIN